MGCLVVAAPNPQNDDPPSIESSTDSRWPRAFADAEGCQVAPEAIVADVDRLAPERHLPEIDERFPAVLEQFQLAIMFDRPDRTAITFGKNASIGHGLGRHSISDAEGNAESEFHQQKHEQSYTQDRPSRLEVTQAPALRPLSALPMGRLDLKPQVLDGRGCFSTAACQQPQAKDHTSRVAGSILISDFGTTNGQSSSFLMSPALRFAAFISLAGLL